VNRADRAVHVSGYAALVAVLATANWANPLAWIVATIFLVGAGSYLAFLLFQITSRHLRQELAEVAPKVAADGGEQETRTTEDWE
jgi:hypothetical protein